MEKIIIGLALATALAYLALRLYRALKPPACNCDSGCDFSRARRDRDCDHCLKRVASSPYPVAR